MRFRSFLNSWEFLANWRVSQADEAHQRALRSAEEEHRRRIAELQEEKSLALEEKELHLTSLLTQERQSQQGLHVRLPLKPNINSVKLDQVKPSFT